MRNLKALGLALIAVFAISAIASSAASANQFHSSVANTTWQRTSSENQEFEYESEGIAIACTTAGGSGQTTAQTVAELTIAPTYSGCTAEGIVFSSAEVRMNECQYLFTLQASQNHGPLHIKCAPEEEITITVKVFGISICTLYIDEQTPTGNASWANNGGAQVNVLFGQSKIIAIRQGTEECGAAESQTGTLQGKVQFRGVETDQTGIANVQVG
jgi:hypothetical protein